MSILDDAIALEEQARAMYLNASRKMTDPGATMLTELLADEEAKHAAALEEMKQEGAELPEELTGPSLLDEVQELIGAAVEGGGTTLFADASMRDVLQQAMDAEQETQRFYNELAESAEDPVHRELFAWLAQRELEHFLLASSLLRYFDRPAAWVESAEFGLRVEEY
jgi:rubrerythrin